MTFISPAAAPSNITLVKIFGRIGVQSFGGPAAQISLMHEVLVDETRWLNEQEFLRALSFCMLLPGPEAMQLATYAGWKIAGIWGGLIAGLLFVIPGAIVIFSLAFAYVTFGQLPLTQTLFTGIKAAVLVIVIAALLKVSKRALKGSSDWIIALSAFIAIFFFALPFPIIILAAAVVGYYRTREMPENLEHTKSRPHRHRNTLLTVFIGLVLWFAPILIIDQVFQLSFFTELSIFFSKLAVVTFGGAYAVLAYMSQDVVVAYGWLTTGEMLDGLGLAETTPGPLILVTQFVGFLAAFKQGGLLNGLLGALLTLWVTFVPCFIWIFAGAPYLERLTGIPKLNGALSAITAAVVGVILNLSIWFGLHVLFDNITATRFGPIKLWLPDLLSANLEVLVLLFLNGLIMFGLKWGIGRLLTISALSSLALSFVF